MGRKEKVGIFGGTFDPPHLGHLHLIVSLMEIRELDQVWVVPAKQNPYKPKDQPVEEKQRLAMTRLAFEKVPNVQILDLELKRPGPSYTIDTLRALQEMKRPDQELSLMMGDDAVENFFRWREALEIVQVVPLLIGRRSSRPLEIPEGTDPSIEKALVEGWTETPIIEISSTAVRERLRKGLYCGHLVPGKVLDTISQHRLY